MKTFILSLFFAVQCMTAEKEFVVGTTSGYAPYVSLDAEGRYEGFDIDFAEALAKKLNRKLVILDLGSMPGLMLGLKKNKVDALIWAISITAERSQKMEMVYYQGEKVTEMPFLFWKKVPEGIRSIDDLKNCVVSVEAGSFQEGVLKKYPDVVLKQVEKITDGIMEIRFGKSQAAMTDPSLIAELTTKYPDLKVIRLPLKPEDASMGNGICIKKESQLAQEVKAATEQLIAEGKVAELEKKWKLGG